MNNMRLLLMLQCTATLLRVNEHVNDSMPSLVLLITYFTGVEPINDIRAMLV